MPADPQTQLTTFRDAVELLGGSRATARGLDVAERTVLRLVSGATPLHDGYLRDIAVLLADHGQRARELERRLSPIFADNLTADQPRETGRRTAKKRPV